MAKAKKAPQKHRIALDASKLTVEASVALSGLTELLCGYSDMTIDKVLESFTLLNAECGGDAKVSLKEDDYFGNSADIVWYRYETDEEFKKRLARNEVNSKAQIKRNATLRKKKIADEKDELKRLRAKYPKE